MGDIVKKVDMKAVRKELTTLNEQRTGYIFQLVHGKPMIHGHAREVFRKCGKKNCRCADGQLHGPYQALSINKGGGQRVVMVKKDGAKDVLKRSKRFRHFRQTVARIRKINREIDGLLEKIKDLTITEYE